ncbi:bifunctional alpha/beta hydrolase/OsmC family protein [Salegentibacter sp. HM20]
MKTDKVHFKNKNGDQLVGYLELPSNTKPKSFALFAHCFTCNKNFFAPKNISRSLAEYGYGVLRFDFTGLGESEGDFATSGFSANVEDLIAAARFLEKEYKAPALLVGHSLGGAAVLYASEAIKSVKAVATIGAPSTVQHVEQHLRGSIDELKKNGSAAINIGGRDFNITDKFLEDIRKHRPRDFMKNWGKALLILHSPGDLIVGIKQAEELYLAAKHPKSFVSLDKADHLLSSKSDAIYTAGVIAAWAKKYVVLEDEEINAPATQLQVVAALGDQGYTTQLKAGKHHFIADEPESLGGNDFGPTPYDLLSASLASCTSMTLQMYARRKKWPLDYVETHVKYSRQHAEDCEDCEIDSAKIDHFDRQIKIEGDLDDSQRNKLLEIADKCPVHKSLTSPTTIKTKNLEKS